MLRVIGAGREVDELGGWRPIAEYGGYKDCKSREEIG